MRLLLLFKVHGDSMLATFKPGQYVVASSMPYMVVSPQAGDVIIVKDPRNGRLLLKRIVTEKNGKFWLEGDNKKASTDSWVFGRVRYSDIYAKVIWW